jgi:PleD family two-component response regulator
MDAKRILIVDDEADIRSVITDYLRDQGYAADQAASGREALEQIADTLPDLVILDVELPDMSGYEVCKRIREIPSTRYTPVIMLTAHNLEKEEIAGFNSGADDYVTKPFRPARLLARITTAIGRNVRDLDANALTHLPGNRAIIQEILKRVGAAVPFSVLYFDLNNFKAYNDRYGFVRGDQAIRMTAQVLERRVAAWDRGKTFLGHIGGDDFVAVIDDHDVGPLCEAIIRDFDATIPSLYDEPDRARGMITSVDRRGGKVDVPLMGIAIAVVTNRQKTFRHPGEVALIAGDLKKWVKSANGSAFVIDRRT